MLNELIGKTLANIDVDRFDDEIIFTTKSGEKYKMFHQQNCCESVRINDIAGDVKDLIGWPILVAEERTSSKNEDRKNYGDDNLYDTSFTWTFYEIATIKGSVTIRWYGSSNGYYSERVHFEKIEEVESEREENEFNKG